MSAQLLGISASTAAIATPVAGSVKLFGKWDASEVEVKDISLTGECRFHQLCSARGYLSPPPPPPRAFVHRLHLAAKCRLCPTYSRSICQQVIQEGADANC